MNSAPLERLKEIFHSARGLPPGERDAFLAGACGSDEQLRQEVEALLESDRATGDFIADPPARLVADAFGGLPDPSDVGRMIGQYKLLECIGSGGMGAVYLAERADQQFQMQVALKLIKRGMDTDSVLRRFQHERQILASLEHPHIARLLDGGTTEDGVPYFVMEYIRGKRIDRYANEQRFSVKERLELFRQVCGAVSYAHQHLVVHRDLKPSNILVTSDGVPKLLDFGIAKIIQADEEASTLATMTAAPILTPEYASPEQMEGAHATTQSDVYSLGVVLYELLTGSKPYRTRTKRPEEIARVIREQEPTRPSENRESKIENRKSLRGDLDNIMLMALRKETARRYRSVEQFSEDIRRHLIGRPVIAQPDTLSYRTTKFVRRNRLALAATAVLLLTLFAGIIATTWQAQKARVQERRARLEQARAERRFNDVRKLANNVLFDYHDAIKDLPGATKVRERLVRDGLNYLDSLASEAQGDQSLQRELASAYERVGDVQGGSLFANLGDTTGAIASYRKSLVLREALLGLASQDFDAQRELALTCGKLGILLWETGDIDAGLANNRRKLDLLESLAHQRPDDFEVRYQLHRGHDNLGMILVERGAFAEALDHHRQALAILEALPATEQKSERIRRSFSVMFEHIGNVLRSTGDLEQALEQNRKAIAVRAALVADFPLNADYRRTLLVGYYYEGAILAKMGRDREALESYLSDFRIAEELNAADPKNIQYRDDLAYVLVRIGEMLERLGDFPEAQQRYRRSLELRTADVKDDPSNLWKRAALIEVHAKLTKLLAKTGENAGALAASKETLALMDQTSLEPTNAGIRGFFAETFVDLGEAHSLLASSSGAAPDQRRAACDMYRRSLEILQDMRDRGILTDADATTPEALAQKISQCDSSQRN